MESPRTRRCGLREPWDPCPAEGCPSVADLQPKADTWAWGAEPGGVHGLHKDFSECNCEHEALPFIFIIAQFGWLFLSYKHNSVVSASRERRAFCFNSMLRSKLPWTSVDKVLPFLTAPWISINHISCSIDLCERREESVHTNEWRQQDSWIRMRMRSFWRMWWAHRSAGNFISVRKKPC